MADTATPTETPTETPKTTETPKAAETKLPPGYRPGFDMPPQPNVGMENDPNFKMREMLARRGKKSEPKAEDKPADTGGKPAETTETTGKKPESTETKTSSTLADLIAKNLKFRQPAGAKPAEKPKEEPKAAATETKPAEPPEKKAEEKPKTIVTKRKAEPTAADHMRVAAQAAAEAATAAVTAALPKSSPATSRAAAPEDELPDDFRYEFEVAKHLAATNPKYKDAPQKILNEYAKRTQYADRWEAQNPGKVFNPRDAEHNELEESLERPWSDHEFNRAAIQMEAKALAAEEAAQNNGKIKAMEEREARRELAASANQTINTVAVMLAQNVDQAAHDTITKDPNGFAKLQESDPIMAEVLVDELNRLAPRIQTAILVDDPQQRIGFDAENNAEQKAWLKYLYEKEAQYAGQVDEAGRLFASRSQFVKLPPEQQARRWFLDVNHVISEMVADAVQSAKTRVEKERERAKKVAAALGYVPKPETNGAGDKDGKKADVTKTAETKKEETATTGAVKPVSPSVGSGAKIDSQGEAVKTKYDDMWGRIGKTLFPR